MSTTTSEFSRDFLNKSLPYFQDIRNVAQNLEASVYIVGGSVRDMLMNIPIGDVDLVPFNIDSADFAKVLAKTIRSVAIPFKDNIRLMKNGLVIDVSNPRGNSIEKDLSLRDFTINNLACNMDGKIIGDKSDIENKIIKTVYDNAFDDDPLRMLRAFRFQSTFGFSIHSSTASLIHAKKNLAPLSAKERILEELKKTFAGEYFQNLFDNTSFMDIINIIAKGCSLNSESVLRLKNLSSESDKKFPIFMALFFEGAGAASFFKSMTLSSKELKTIGRLLKAEKNINFALLENINERRITAWRYYDDISDICLFLKCKYPTKTQRLEELEKAASDIDPSRALTIGGGILKAMGLAPSPLFSTILSDAKEKLAIGEVDPKDIKEYIKRKYKI